MKNFQVLLAAVAFVAVSATAYAHDDAAPAAGAHETTTATTEKTTATTETVPADCGDKKGKAKKECMKAAAAKKTEDAAKKDHH